MIHLSLDYRDDRECSTPSEYLRYYRTFQGISTKELAEKVGIVPATLTLYESDNRPIKYSTAVALSKELGIDRKLLFDEYTAFVDYPCQELLQRVRKDLSLTQAQVAEEIGVAQNTYSSWECRNRTPRRQEYNKIVAVFKKWKVDIARYSHICPSASAQHIIEADKEVSSHEKDKTLSVRSRMAVSVT